MARLYISQDRMDTWSSENKVEIEGDVMTLVELERSFLIRPAVRFLRVAGADEDPHDLVGKVKDNRELADMEADLMASSVLYAETAYDVENGFVGDPISRPQTQTGVLPRDADAAAVPESVSRHESTAPARGPAKDGKQG